jgi:hypothetical protein
MANGQWLKQKKEGGKLLPPSFITIKRLSLP